ncbi:MAG: DMT family transporter [Methylocystaceae bacterium]|nr:DMT family transporter [Methylocystaceae bacterium]
MASMDACAKYLGQFLPVEQVLWARYFVQSTLITVFLWRREGTNFLYCHKPVLQFIRSLSLISATACAYLVFQYLSLSDATAIFFFAPVLVTILSGVILKEPITVGNILIVLCGFAGVLIIIQPGASAFEWISLSPLFCAFMLATYLLMTRVLQTTDKESSTMFYSTAIGSIGLSFVMPFTWVNPDPNTIFFMVLIGSLGTLGHFALIKAFGFSSASSLSPFLYAQLLFATVLSVLIFEDSLTSHFVLGTVILVGSGLAQWKLNKRNV